MAKKISLVFEALASPSVKNRMIYQLAKSGTGARVLVVNSEYYRECNQSQDDVYMIGNSETEVVMPLIGNSAYWLKIADAFNAVEPFKSFSKNKGRIYIIPWLSAFDTISEHNVENLRQFIEELSDTHSLMELRENFEKGLASVDLNSVSDESANAVKSCMESLKRTPESLEILDALIKFYKPVTKHKELKTLDLSSVQGTNTLIVTTIECLNRNTYASVAYSLLLNMNFTQYLDEGALRVLDGNDFWERNRRVAAVAVRNSQNLICFPSLLRRASQIFANASTLSGEKAAVNTWLALNYPLLFNKIPEDSVNQIQRNTNPTKALVQYLTCVATEIEENGEKKKKLKLMLLYVDEEEQIRYEEVNKDRVTDHQSKQPQASQALEELGEKLTDLKTEVASLKQGLDSATEARTEIKDDPFQEYPDDFSKRYEDMWTRYE